MARKIGARLRKFTSRFLSFSTIARTNVTVKINMTRVVAELTIALIVCSTFAVAQPRLSITQFSASGSEPTAITVGPDGALWFIAPTNSGPNIGRTSIGGATTFYRIPTAGTHRTTSITAGADGALWFTDYGAIGRITVVRAPSLVSCRSTANSQPSSITAGPDGALWFTEFKAIGRITTDGVVTEFALP